MEALRAEMAIIRRALRRCLVLAILNTVTVLLCLLRVYGVI